MISNKMKTMVSNSSVIRAMFEEGKRLSEIYGEENVFDYSIGNPNIEAPSEIKDIIIKILNEENPNKLHGYMNNSGYEDVREGIAENINVKYNTNLQGIISQKGIVVQDIEPYEVGVVKLNGEEWSAISKDKVKIKKGSIVEVVQIEGVKLIVKEVSNINLDLENNKKNKDSISREIDIKIKTSK